MRTRMQRYLATILVMIMLIDMLPSGVLQARAEETGYDVIEPVIEAAIFDVEDQMIPEAVIPESIEPEVIQPEVVVPETAEPEIVVPEIIVPEIIEPEIIVTEAPVVEIVEPVIVTPEPEITIPENIEAETAAPVVIEPEVVVPEVIVPESAPEKVEFLPYYIEVKEKTPIYPSENTQGDHKYLEEVVVCVVAEQSETVLKVSFAKLTNGTPSFETGYIKKATSYKRVGNYRGVVVEHDGLQLPVADYVVESTPEPTVEVTEAPVAEETNAPAVEETQEPAAEVTEAPVPEETNAPAAEVTEAPAETEEPSDEPTVAPTEDPDETQGEAINRWGKTTHKGKTNVRSEMNKKSTAVAVLPKGGTYVWIISKEPPMGKYAWYQVSVDGKTGYVREDLVEPLTQEASDSYQAMLEMFATPAPSIDPAPAPEDEVTPAPTEEVVVEETTVPTDEPAVEETAAPTAEPELEEIDDFIEELTEAEILEMMGIQEGDGLFAMETMSFDPMSLMMFAAGPYSKPGTFTINGSINFNDADYEWKDLIHPTNPSQDIVLSAAYQMADGVPGNSTITPQMTDPNGECYLVFNPDGTFMITNVPKQLTLGEDNTVAVTSYSVSYDAEYKPYQKTTSPNPEITVTDEMTDSASVSFDYAPWLRSVTLKAEVHPDGADYPGTGFTMDVKLTYDGKTIDAKIPLKDQNGTTIQVPNGVSYEVTQEKPASGLTLETTYEKDIGGSKHFENNKMTGTIENIPDLSQQHTITITSSNFDDSKIKKTSVQIGAIAFNDTIDGTDWSGILRPKEFDGEVHLMAYYKDEHGVWQTKEITAQDSISTQNYYMSMILDGKGGARIEVDKIPEYIEVDGNFRKVTSYDLFVADYGPYYTKDSFVIDDFNKEKVTEAITLTLDVHTKDVTLKTNVVPGTEMNPGFTMEAKFTNPDVETFLDEPGVPGSFTITTERVPGGNGTTIKVPEGLTYEVKQVDQDGYLLEPKYEVTHRYEYYSNIGNYAEVKGKLEDYDLIVESTNVAQNMTYAVNVEWIDGPNSVQKTVDASYFDLQFKTADGEWKTLTEADLATLGITRMPEFNQDLTNPSRYYYSGLPFQTAATADQEPKVLEYQVVPHMLYDAEGKPTTPFTPNGYVTDYKNDKPDESSKKQASFVYTKMTSFNAEIKWLDDNNAFSSRPDAISDLYLYRSTDGENYELVKTDALTVTGSGSTWNVRVDDLPMYSSEEGTKNQEYDYVLVHGVSGTQPKNFTVNDQTSTYSSPSFVDKQADGRYVHYYVNETGVHSTDTKLCHNGGTIQELHAKPTTYGAKKEWADGFTEATKDERPKATVTLWRYTIATPANWDPTTMQEPAEWYNIDKNFSNASQVILYNDKTDPPTEILVSELLGKNEPYTIDFDTTLHGRELPQYDAQGRKYVYFTRESVDSYNYETFYYAKNENNELVPVKDGAPAGGIIRNVYREKAAVNVTVEWKCPSVQDLLLEGKKVRVTILAKDEDGVEKELVVYSDAPLSYDVLNEADKKKAQTVAGFDENIASLDLMFYVNIYDENGKPYQMNTAKIQEIEILEEGTDEAGNKIDVTVAKVEDNKFTLKDEANEEYDFKVTTDKKDDTTIPDGTPDGMKQFNFGVTNTITGKLDYTLIKRWGENLRTQWKDKYETIKYIDFRVEYVSSQGGSNWADLKDKDGNYVLVTLPLPMENVEDKGDVVIWSKLLEKQFDKYDEDGFLIRYRAFEYQFLDANKQKVDPGSDWWSYHGRTEDSTTVTNDAGGSSTPYFTASKEWMDNADVNARKKATVGLYLRADVLAALKNYDDGDVISAQKLKELIEDTTGNVKGKVHMPDKALSESNAWSFISSQLSTINYEVRNNRPNDTKDTKTFDWDYTKDYTYYMLLEYRVGEYDVNYTVAQLRNAAGTTCKGNYTVVGHVTTDNRQYKVEITNYSDKDTSKRNFYLTNTRTGEVKLTIQKEWKDNSNEGHHRLSSVQFQLVRNGEDYRDPIVLKADPEAPEADIWVREYPSVEEEPIPLFNDYGVPYVYTLREIAVQPSSSSSSSGSSSSSDDEDGSNGAEPALASELGPDADPDPDATPNTDPDGSNNNNVTVLRDYFSRMEIPVVTKMEGADPDTLHYSFKFINTISLETSHTIVKIWEDEATKGDHRPDLVISAERYLLNDPDKKTEPVTLQKDPEWTEHVANDGYGDYDWKITIDHLPQYDANGNMYVYTFAESMSNNGKNVYGQYVQQTPKQGTRTNADGTVETFDIFTNTLTDSTTISSNKVWSISKEYQTTDEGEEKWPNVTILLYRATQIDPSNRAEGDPTCDHTAITQRMMDNMSEADLTKYVQTDKCLTLVDYIELKDNTTISFPNTARFVQDGVLTPDGQKAIEDKLIKNDAIGKNDPPVLRLPKFDAEGRAYTYLMYETVGTPGPDGLPNVPEGTDLEVIKQLYKKTSASGTLENQFRTDVNRREIEVEKIWGSRPNGVNENEYHSVTYTLYRYLQSDRNKVVELKTFKVDAKHFENAEKVKKGKPIESVYPMEYTDDDVVLSFKNGNVCCTFKDLLIYSPTGQLYGYYVTEAPISGYAGAVYTDEEHAVQSLAAENRSDVNSKPDLEAAFNSDSKPKAEVSVTNNYTAPGSIYITGQKIWDDYGNFEHVRPTEVTFTLKRYTNSEVGADDKPVGNNVVKQPVTIYDPANMTEDQKAAVGFDKNTSVYIEWTKPDGQNAWTYTIYNLLQYAHNGMPYIYELTENTDKNYQADKPTQTVTGPTPGKTGKEDLNYTNSFKGTYVVTKNWLDGFNRYGLRPDKVTMVLQRKKASDTVWSVIPARKLSNATLKDKKNRIIEVEYNEQQVVGVELTVADSAKNTKNSTWTYTFTNLPIYYYEDGQEQQWQYRVIEVLIGTKDAGTQESGYKRTYTVKNKNDAFEPNNETVVQNTLDSTTLQLTKTWLDDEDNQYFTRPYSLHFTLWMQLYDPSNSNNIIKEWYQVPDPDVPGKYITHELTGPDWTYTFHDLPQVVSLKSDDGATETYYTAQFKAVEDVVVGGQVTGALNYMRDSEEHGRPDGATYNVSNISNRLTTDTDISVTKTWHQRDDAEECEAVFELLYRKVDTTDWLCFTSAEAVKNGTVTPVVVSDLTDPKAHLEKADGSARTDLKCVTKRVSNKATGDDLIVKWEHLPKFDRDGYELEYMVVEYPIPGYKQDSRASDPQVSTDETDCTKRDYAFENTQLQNYTVSKTWFNADYAQKDEDGKFTATFKLQQRIGNGGWTDVAGAAFLTLSTTSTTGVAETASWTNLPYYTDHDEEITYRAVETSINGVSVEGNTNGDYVVTYLYGSANAAEPQFGDTITYAHNRMVYGFVNLTKQGATLDNDVVTANNQKLAGVKFGIYRTGEDEPFVTVYTNEDGHLIPNSNGSYGSEGSSKYLVCGTYELKELAPLNGYSQWNGSVTFVVGQDGNGNTGEHGTAWISTPADVKHVTPRIDYFTTPTDPHAANDSCTAQADTVGNTVAYNIESRGVIDFTKTGSTDSDALNTTTVEGLSQAYFAVYKDGVQVAGMVAQDSDHLDHMVLTNKGMDGDPLSDVLSDGIPYLRLETNGQLTLLSGDYTIVELRAPAGYKLDSTPRALNIPNVETTELNSTLSDVYAGNSGTIDGNLNYKWHNDPNKVTIYKRDQYGRPVLSLKGPLELKVSTGKFLTGEDTIHLKQNTTEPCEEAAVFVDDTNTGIKYNGDGTWTLIGVLDAGKTYILSEPVGSVPDNYYLIANEMTFTMGADGQLTVKTGEDDSKTVEKTDPTSADGDDMNNYFATGTDNNQLVLRDVARSLKNVQLYKYDNRDNQPIPYISFEVYKYDGLDANSQAIDKDHPQRVLAEGVYLTTNAQGYIDLSDPNSVTTDNDQVTDQDRNLITNCDLSKGLDVGKYYFQEVERGASDRYLLHGKVYFEIKQANGTDPDKTAVVKFDVVSDDVTQEADSTVGKVANTPAKTTKTLSLAKKDKENDENGDPILLEGAVFALSYVSITDGQVGAQTPVTVYGKTSHNGMLYEVTKNADGSYTFKLDAQDQLVPLDIANKGTYTLKEIKAPDCYMTRTDDNGDPVTMLTFTVDSDNKIVNVSKYDGQGNLVPRADPVSNDAGAHICLDAVIANEKTVVYIDKLNDIYQLTKNSNQTELNGERLPGAELAIYKGETPTGAPNEADLVGSSWTSGTADDIPHKVVGDLIEGQSYTLHEISAPDGYLPANNIIFKVDGTITRDGETVSRLFVKVDGTWVETSNITDDYDLAMVDEAVIAPVDMTKMLGTKGPLEGAKFDVKQGTTLLGIAITKEDGHLKWDKITEDGVASGLIFDTGDKRITRADQAEGDSIILRKVNGGYTFTESEAPAEAYNDGRVLLVSINDSDYTQYKANHDYSVTIKDTQDEMVVNQPYVSTVKLHKYDQDAEANKAAIAGAEFTLYHATKNDDGEIVLGSIATNDEAAVKVGTGSSGVFVTSATDDHKGDLEIEIYRKGLYVLKETNPATGYVGHDDEDYNGPSYEFKLIDGTSEQVEAKEAFVYGGTADLAKNEIKGNTDGVPNDRLMGKVTLEKKDKDADNSSIMDGVVFTLRRTDNSNNSQFPNELTEVDVVVGNKYEAQQGADGVWRFTMHEDTTNHPNELKPTASGDEYSGKIVIDGLNWAEYELVEKTENPGYIYPDPPEVVPCYPFEIKAEKLDPTLNEDHKVLYNNKNRLTLTKQALDEEFKGLSGAEFKLYVVDNNKVNLTSDPIKFYTSADATSATGELITIGKTTIFGLRSGRTYLLHETKAPDGYELNVDVVFTMGRNGNIADVYACKVESDGTVQKITDTTTVWVNVPSNPLHDGRPDPEIQVRNKPIEVKLTKALSGSGDVLTGREDAVYEITGAKFAGTTETKLTLTGNEIQAKLKAKLIAGQKYTITELRAPAGYEVYHGADMLTIKVNTDGSVDVIKVNADGTETIITDGALTANNATDVAELTLTDDPIELKLAKYGLTGTTALTGAVFTVSGTMYNRDTHVIANDDVNVTVDNVSARLKGRLIGKDSYGNGVYTIKEIHAPDGYLCTPEFTITIDKNGEVTKSSDLAEIDSTDSEKLIVRDKPTKVSFVKMDDNGKLAGAEFELTATSAFTGESPFVNPSKDGDNQPITSITWTSSSTEAETLENRLIAGVVYELTEVNRMPNHEWMGENTDAKTIKFHVDQYSGNVVIEQNGNATIPNNFTDDTHTTLINAAKVGDDGITMTIQNPIIKGKVTLTKYWRDNEDDTTYAGILPGAEYELYGQLIQSNGAYAAAEPIKTDSSNAYAKSGSKASFTTDENGKITITGLPEGKYQFREIAAPLAYHVNNAADGFVEFEIHNGNAAEVTDKKDVDTRINATIELSKWSENSRLSGAVFEVFYKPEQTDPESAFKSIGVMEQITNTDGDIVYTLVKGTYPGETTAEGLRRGIYRIVENNAPGQMLNPNDNADTRNTITFEIGNDIKKKYVVSTTDEDSKGNLITYTLSGAGEKFISWHADGNGVDNTPIPTKSVSVTKDWVGDNTLTSTFRPTSIQVALYRSYIGANGQPTTPERVPDMDTITLEADEDWTKEDAWTDLPAYFNDPVDPSDPNSVCVTRLYTYSVQEVHPTDGSVKTYWDWYADTYVTGYSNETNQLPGKQSPNNVQDGDTTAPVTNTMLTGKLNITKTLGGGDPADEFQVRVILTDSSGHVVGNDANGYYLDAYTLVEDGTKLTPAENGEGWVTIKGGQTLSIDLPIGVHYEVQERTKDGDATLAYENNTTLDYVPRYVANKTGTISGTAVTASIRNAVVKHLSLFKYGEGGIEKVLPGALFDVEYSKPNGYNGDSTWVDKNQTFKCITGADGMLYLANADGEATNEKLDITNQGTYVIKETQAPVNGSTGYMTPTDNNGVIAPLATITVKADDTIDTITREDTSLVTKADIMENGSIADLEVKNRKTTLSIDKVNDIVEKTKSSTRLDGEPLPGATLTLYDSDGHKVVDPWTTVIDVETGKARYTIAPGKLIEGKVYTLEESAEGTPNGYLTAQSITFRINGSYIRVHDDGTKTVESRLEVLTGTSPGYTVTDANNNENVLTMVDEAVIAPVDLIKEVGTSGKLEGAKFTVKQGNTTLGTAITNNQGHLVWDTISKDGYESGLIFYDMNGKDKRVDTADDANLAKNKRIILRKIDNAYTQSYNFTEYYAPDNAFNQGQDDECQKDGFTIKIKDDDYASYMNNRSIYWKHITDTDTDTTGILVNPAFETTFQLYKFDEHQDSSRGSEALEGVVFKLEKVKNTDGTIPSNFTPLEKTTEDDGVVTFTIPEKGTYQVTEITPLSGYKPITPSMEFTIVNSDYKKTLTYDASTTNMNHTTVIEDRDGVPVYDTAGNPLAPASVANSRTPGSITLTKTDAETHEKLNGVKYTLTRIGPDPADDIRLYPADTAKARELETGMVYTLKDWNVVTNTEITSRPGNDGELIIDNLQWGTYQLVETNELSGYKKDTTPIIFTVGERQLQEDGTYVRELDPSRDMTNVRNQVTFSKTDLNGAPLNGAVFEVHAGESCSSTCVAVPFYASDTAETTVNTVTSGEGGTVSIYGLPTDPTGTDNPKTYHLVETKAPLGYTIAAPVVFTMARDGAVQVKDATTNEMVNATNLTVTMRDEPIEITIEKVGEALNKLLPGAVFKLEDACTTSSCETQGKLAKATTDPDGIDTDAYAIATTDNIGRAKFTALCIAGHTYTLTETKAPDGYECTAVVTFTVKDDGTIDTSSFGSTGGYHNEDDKCATLIEPATIQVANEKIRLTLVKQDMDEPEIKLSNVEFTLEPVTGSSFVDNFEGLEGDKWVGTTDENGEISIPLHLLKHSNYYLLTETSLGDDNPTYRIANNKDKRSVTLFVTPEGTLEFKKPPDGQPHTDNAYMFSLAMDENGQYTQIVVKNEKIKLAVKKMDEAVFEDPTQGKNANGLADVVLKLSRKNETSRAFDPVTDVEPAPDGSGQWWTTTDAMSFTGLIPGTYKVEEISTVENYNRLIWAVEFTINAAGVVETATAVKGTEDAPDNPNVALDGKAYHGFCIDNTVDGGSGSINLYLTNPHYSTLQLTKIGVGGMSNEVPLPGVVFKLKKPDGTVIDNITTNTEGIATIENLEDGQYILTEVKTADNYNLLSTSLTISIDRKREEYLLDGQTGYMSRTSGTNTIALTIYNKKGFSLPATGTTTPQLPLTILLAVALLEAAVLYAYAHPHKRKRRGVKSG